jgi:hypothetical protein
MTRISQLRQLISLRGRTFRKCYPCLFHTDSPGIFGVVSYSLPPRDFRGNDEYCHD